MRDRRRNREPTLKRVVVKNGPIPAASNENFPCRGLNLVCEIREELLRGTSSISNDRLHAGLSDWINGSRQIDDLVVARYADAEDLLRRIMNRYDPTRIRKRREIHRVAISECRPSSGRKGTAFRPTRDHGSGAGVYRWRWCKDDQYARLG